MYRSYVDTPCGLWEIAADDAIRRVYPVQTRTDAEESPLTREAARQLSAYFAGSLRTFCLPAEPAGTPFQRAVWQALERIPYGETVCYADVARAVGNPRAVRAVGRAIGRNPVLVLIPCHRVIGKDGALTGFGAGLPVKQALLALERAHRSEDE